MIEEPINGDMEIHPDSYNSSYSCPMCGKLSTKSFAANSTFFCETEDCRIVQFKAKK